MRRMLDKLGAYSTAVLFLVGFAGIGFIVIDTSYHDRKDGARLTAHSDRINQEALRGDNIRLCRRGLHNAGRNAEGWYNAYRAREAQAKIDPPGAARNDELRAAATYLQLARGLNQNTRPPFSVTWPYVNPSQHYSSKVVRHYVLGRGKLNCEATNPLPPAPPPAPTSILNLN